MWKKILSIFTSFYIPILLLSLILMNSQKVELISSLSQAEERAAIDKKNFLAGLFNHLVTNTHYWSSIEYPEYFNPANQHSEFIRPYLEIINGISIYDQFRFIDLEGLEMLRYQREVGNKMAFAPLQNKNKQGYVQQSLGLKRNQIYLSKIDLNKENGEIEKPHKPVIRVVGPIFDSLDRKIGLVVINYRMKPILDQLKEQIAEGNFYLVDSELRIITSNT
ncbi:MAG: cache domain-containing protein, partial [Pricia sp.]|nr:cache domain-containing protein [Pricia sp.]